MVARGIEETDSKFLSVFLQNKRFLPRKIDEIEREVE